MDGKLFPAKIFISYRRGENAREAERLAQELRKDFHKDSVFLDSYSIPMGAYWGNHIRQSLQDSAVVLVLIGEHWTTALTQDGTRRLHADDDWVRQEVDIALSRHDITVIPLVLGVTPVPTSNELPDGLQKLPLIQVLRLSEETWVADIRQLVERIRGLKLIPAAEFDFRAIDPANIDPNDYASPFDEVLWIWIKMGLVTAAIFAAGLGFLTYWWDGEWFNIASVSINAFALVGMFGAQFLIDAWNKGSLAQLSRAMSRYLAGMLDKVSIRDDPVPV